MYKDIGTRAKINTLIINHKQILAYFMIELLKIKHFLEAMGSIGFFWIFWSELVETDEGIGGVFGRT